MTNSDSPTTDDAASTDEPPATNNAASTEDSPAADDSPVTGDSPVTDESLPTDDSSVTDESPPTDDAEESASTDAPIEESADAEELRATVAALTDRVAQLERAVAWMARQQAVETGNSVCPECHTGGSLRASRSPTGKKQVQCRNCGEKIN